MPRAFLKSSPIDNLFFVTSASSPPWGRGPRINCGAVKRKTRRRLFDVDYLGAELCELGANIGLGDQLPGTDRTDALQGPKAGVHARRLRSFQPFDPGLDSGSKLLNLVFVLDKPRGRATCNFPPSRIKQVQINIIHKHQQVARLTAIAHFKSGSQDTAVVRRGHPTSSRRHSIPQVGESLLQSACVARG